MSIWNFLCCRESQEQKLARVSTKRKSKIEHTTPHDHKKEQAVLDKKVDHSTNPTLLIQNSQKQQEEFNKVQKKNTYSGEQLNGLPHGTGSMLEINGDFYQGDWVRGLKEGRGTQNYFEIRSKYEGEWKRGEFNGEGKYTQENGSYYKGQFKNGKKHGKGQYYDNETENTYEQLYYEGILKERIEKNRKKQKVEQFPTLFLDKERFNTEDLQKFEEKNQQIKRIDINYLLKYYGLSKIYQLPFIQTPINKWNITEVLDFLEEIGLKEYRKVFYENKMKGKDLLNLDDDQLKGDLKMKLGDRKRLTNYIQYLTSLNKTRKAEQKKKTPKRRGSINLSSKSKLKQTILSVQQRISEAENEDETVKEETQKLKKINLHKNYDTQGWQQQNQNLVNDEDKSDKSPSRITIKSKKESSVSSKEQIPKGEPKEHFVQTTKTNRSENHHENLANSLVQIHSKINEKRERSRSKSVSSENSKSSSSSLDEEMLKLKKKKTVSNGSQQIRELYEFLKENKGLGFIIKKKDIEITEQIGEGGYGKVYRGKYMGCPVAVKDYMKAGRNHKSREQFMKEVYILSELKHPNIVLYMGMCITVNQYQLVTEFLQNGSLFDQIHKRKTIFDSDEIFQIIDDIVRGMVYLHSMKGMIHKDLKSSNVLIDEDWKVKLCDFGLSSHKRKKKKKSLKNRVGTIQWMAPEVIRSEQADYYSDVYSFGVIVWELLTRKIPYEGLTEAQITGLIGYDDKHTLPSPPEESDSFIKGLMEKCLQKDPSVRPTFIQIQKELDEERKKRPNMKVDWSNK